MSFRDETGRDDAFRHPYSRGPLTTEFTAAVPDKPSWQQGLRTPRADELGLMRPRRPIPQQGWRKVLHRTTRGKVNVGESVDETRYRMLVDRVNQPVRGSYSIAVLSLKGGVGKTTVTVGLGATFASLRGDRVIAVDANPDFGTLAQRGPDETRSTVRDVSTDGGPQRYPDMRRHTSQISSRLEILASERDPAVSEAFSEDDYRAVHKVLDRFYNIILTDCGTGMTHSAMRGVLDTADALIVVASPSIDAARSALATLDWLMCHGHGHLVPEASVVISSSRPGAVPVDLDQMAQHLLLRVRTLSVISYDPHLCEGGQIVLDLINRKTQREFVELAASVADGFARKGA